MHSTVFGEVEVLQDTVCIVSGKRSGGKILALVAGADADSKMEELGLQVAVHGIPVPIIQALKCVLCSCRGVQSPETPPIVCRLGWRD